MVHSCCAKFDLLDGHLMADLSLKLPSCLLPPGWLRVKTAHSSRPPINLMEGSVKSPRRVGIGTVFVCCWIQIETLQCFGLTVRNSKFVSSPWESADYLRIRGKHVLNRALAPDSNGHINRHQHIHIKSWMCSSN
jgi:hypothetical protein